MYIQTYTHVSLRPRKGDIGVAEGEGSPLVHGDIKKIYSPWLKIAQFCKLSLRALSSQQLDMAESFSGFAGDFRQCFGWFSQSTINASHESEGALRLVRNFVVTMLASAPQIGVMSQSD